MNFLEKNTLLQSIYRKQHDLSNQIDGASFAEEKGQLSSDESIALEQKQHEFELLEKEASILREDIKNNYSSDYTAHLSLLHKDLILIQTKLNALTGEIEFKQSFNKILCQSLLPDISKLMQDKKIKNSYHWLFDVSRSLIHEYSIVN